MGTHDHSIGVALSANPGRRGCSARAHPHAIRPPLAVRSRRGVVDAALRAGACSHPELASLGLFAGYRFSRGTEANRNMGCKHAPCHITQRLKTPATRRLEPDGGWTGSALGSSCNETEAHQTAPTDARTNDDASGARRVRRSQGTASTCPRSQSAPLSTARPNREQGSCPTRAL